MYVGYTIINRGNTWASTVRLSRLAANTVEPWKKIKENFFNFVIIRFDEFFFRSANERPKKQKFPLFRWLFYLRRSGTRRGLRNNDSNFRRRQRKDFFLRSAKLIDFEAETDFVNYF